MTATSERCPVCDHCAIGATTNGRACFGQPVEWRQRALDEKARADAAEANDARMCLAVHAEADAIGDIAQTFELGPARAALYAVVDRLRRVAGDRAALKETP